MGFTLLDRFPIKKGTLCTFSEEANKTYKAHLSIYGLGELQEDHRYYGKNLIAISDPYISNGSGICIEIYCQQTMEYDKLPIEYLVPIW